MSKVEPKFVQHLRAKNDVNGNPQRCFVIYFEDDNFIGVCDVIDEGYAGLPTWARKLPQLPSVEVSVREYKSFLKMAAKS